MSSFYRFAREVSTGIFSSSFFSTKDTKAHEEKLSVPSCAFVDNLRPGKAKRRIGKLERAAKAPALLTWARDAHVELSPALRAELRDGFGASADGEDRFDATVGLLGMLNVVLKRRPPGEPDDEVVRRVEGWILGSLVES